MLFLVDISPKEHVLSIGIVRVLLAFCLYVMISALAYGYCLCVCVYVSLLIFDLFLFCFLFLVVFVLVWFLLVGLLKRNKECVKLK